MRRFHCVNLETSLETMCVRLYLNLESTWNLPQRVIAYGCYSWIEEDHCLDIVIIQFYWYQTEARLTESSPYSSQSIDIQSQDNKSAGKRRESLISYLLYLLPLRVLASLDSGVFDLLGIHLAGSETRLLNIVTEILLVLA